MNDIDKLARAVAKQMGGLNDYEDSDFHIIKTALAAYANDYCDSLLFVLADIRQKTGVGDKPMLGELADAIVANKLAYGDECAKQMREDAAYYAEKHGLAPGNKELHEVSSKNRSKTSARQLYANAIRALPIPSEVTK